MYSTTMYMDFYFNTTMDSTLSERISPDTPSTMFKQGAIKMFERESTSLTQSQKCQRLVNNHLKQIATQQF